LEGGEARNLTKKFDAPWNQRDAGNILKNRSTGLPSSENPAVIIASMGQKPTFFWPLAHQKLDEEQIITPSRSSSSRTEKFFGIKLRIGIGDPGASLPVLAKLVGNSAGSSLAK